jgi:hypothetical protein
MFDAVFAAVSLDMMQGRSSSVIAIDGTKLEQLKRDPEFLQATQKATAATTNVTTRLQRAKAILNQ